MPGADASGADRSADWRPGDVVLDLYEVVRGKAKGAMGVVYRVHHPVWGIDLAVKVPRAALLHSPDAVREFETEAETWAGLGVHPHVVNCAYVRRIGSTPAVFAEWAPGGSVAEAVRSGGLYADDPVGSVLDVAIQSAWGLAFAHGQGMVHQDVKPANLMLTADGTVKVTDFGLARMRRLAGETPDGVGTAAGAAVRPVGFSLPYRSPEQAAATAGTTLTPATDVWSWAVTVVEMFRGERPDRTGEEAGALLAGLRHRGVVDGLPALPGPVADLLAECLRPDPAGRPADVGALAERLVALYAELTGRAYPRRLPSQARLLADGLSNRALSMLDLGRPDQSERLWEQALDVDPRHLHTVYNRGLHRWRDGRAGDVEVQQELLAAGPGDDDGTYEHLLGLLHQERGDPPPALTLEGHSSSIVSVAVSTDGTVGATLDGSGVLRVWDLGTGDRRTAVPAAENGGVAVVLAPDGSFAVVLDGIGYARVWHLARPTAPVRLGSRLDRVRDVAVAPGGARVVTLGIDGRVRAWDPATGTLDETWEPPGSDGDARPLALDPTGTRRADLYDGARVVLSTIDDPADRQVLHGWNGDVRFAAAGSTALAVADDGSVRVFAPAGDGLPRTDEADPVAPRRPTAELRGARWPLAPSGDGRYAYGAGAWWDLAIGRRLYTGAHRGDLSAVDHAGRVALSASGTSATVDRRPESVQVPWSYTRPRDAVLLSTESDAASGALARSASLAAAGRLQEAAQVVREARDLPGLRRDPRLTERWRRLGTRARRLHLQDAWPVRELRAPPGQDWLLSAASDGPLVLAHSPRHRTPWVVDRTAPEAARPLRLHAGPVTAAALSPDGSVAVSAASDARVIVWDAARGSVRRLVEVHRSPPRVVAAGRGVTMTGSPAGEVGIIDVGRGLLALTDAHAGSVRALAIAPGCQIGLSSAEDGSVRSWDLTSGALLQTLRFDDAWAHRAALSRTGHRAVLWTTDDELRLWSPRNGATLAVLSAPRGGRPTSSGTHSRYVTTHEPGRAEFWDLDQQGGRVAISDDGRWALTADRAGALRTWDLDSGRCTATLAEGAVRVTALTVTPGFDLAAVARDYRVDLWDLATGELVRSVDLAPHPAEDLVLAPDGAALTTFDSLGRLRDWVLDWELELPAEGGPLDPGTPQDATPAGTGADLDVGDGAEGVGAPWLRLLDAELAREELRRQVDRTVVRGADPGTGSDTSSDAAAIAQAVALLDLPETGLTVEERVRLEDFRHRVGEELSALADVARSAERAGRHRDAEPLLRLALGIRSTLDGAGAPGTRTALRDLAGCWTLLGRVDEAQALLTAGEIAPRAAEGDLADHAAPDHALPDADVERMTSRLVALQAESRRLLDREGPRAAMGPAEEALAVARVGAAQDRAGVPNLALALASLGDLCNNAGLPFAAARYLAEALVVSARAERDGIGLIVPLDTVAGVLLAATVGIDSPYGTWFRQGHLALVREEIDPGERGLLRELMHWCDEAGRELDGLGASNWALFCHGAAMIVGEVMRDDDPSFTDPLCATLLTIAGLKAGTGDRDGAVHLLRRAVGLAYRACLADEGDVEPQRALARTLDRSAPVLDRLGEGAHARAAERSAAELRANAAGTYAGEVPYETALLVQRLLGQA
ncbi:protein kinase [Promicromonospora sp. NPDC060204]|uniref:protein kinase domain-containing protein n=1 Tax=Promicromonospora sp. NPDC060204 TaxID=3347071 RepID=UPI003666999C